MACCAFDETVDEQFTNDKASQEMDRYRRKGVGPTTRRLLDGLARAGLVESSVLDVGAGIGSLTFELLDRGCRHATIVEASAAYARAASEEAARRGRATDVDFIRGDFLDVVPAALFAGIVALDRVVCCYPLYEPLLGAALRCAEHGVAISYPKDRWYTRAVIGFENARRRRRNKRFRTFVHPEADMRKVIEGAGFELVFRRTTLMWSADVYRRRGSRVATSRRPVLS